MSKTKAGRSKQSSDEDSSHPSNQKAEDKLAIHLAETAWRVAVPFLIFSLGGIWLDSRLESEPMFTLIGIALALVSVFYIVYKYVNKHFPNTFGGDK